MMDNIIDKNSLLVYANGNITTIPANNRELIHPRPALF
jgi:hypothetical protein